MSGGHVVSRILDEAMRKAGLGLYVQACGPHCRHGFVHIDLRLESTSELERVKYTPSKFFGEVVVGGAQRGAWPISGQQLRGQHRVLAGPQRRHRSRSDLRQRSGKRHHLLQCLAEEDHLRDHRLDRHTEGRRVRDLRRVAPPSRRPSGTAAGCPTPGRGTSIATAPALGSPGSGRQRSVRSETAAAP